MSDERSACMPRVTECMHVTVNDDAIADMYAVSDGVKEWRWGYADGIECG